MLLSAGYRLSRFAPLIDIINAYFIPSVKLLCYEAEESSSLQKTRQYI